MTESVMYHKKGMGECVDLETVPLSSFFWTCMLYQFIEFKTCFTPIVTY